jgi:hypothetical protein
MQEQAAPPRFRGEYPHVLNIPNAFLPRDKFFVAGMKRAAKKGLIFYKGHQVIGHFPKLLLKVQDPEIRSLAGDDLGKFDDIDCKDITCTCMDKPRYLQLFAHTTADRDSLVYNPCKRTLFAAAKRQIKSAPVPDAKVAQAFLSWAKRKIDVLIGDDLREFGYSYNQWYNHLTLAKQKRMDAVHEFMHGHDPLKTHYSGIEKLDPKLLHYEAICKIEVQSTDGKPRMVCAIPDIIKYVMGPVCWRLEELFTHKIPTYCGGMNLQQMQDKINHYIDDGFTVVAEGDGSAFDNTQDVLLKEIDRYIYNLILDRIHHVDRALFELIANSCYKVMDVVSTEGKVKRTLMTYAVLGTVFSGDCDTTLMNTLRMGLYNWFTNEAAGLELGSDFVCFSKGDDFTVMYKRSVNLEAVKLTYQAYWLGKPKPNGPAYDGCDERVYGLGQILKFIDFGPPETIKFCSLRAWITNPHTQHIYLTRDPGKFTTLAKYSRKALHLGGAQLAQYCLDQAIALETAYPGVAYFTDMALAYRKMARYYGQGFPVVAGHGGKCRDKRRILDLEVSDPYNGYLYTPRQTVIKIEGQYWETMKRYAEADHSALSHEELTFVNRQISEEFADRPLWLFEAGRPY